MALPNSLLPSTCDIYRPFGDASPTTADVPCRLSPALTLGNDKLALGGLAWSHTLDVQPGVDIRDGCSRSTGSDAITFTDGDEVRVPSGGATRYVVVWVETVGRDTAMQYQRAYLLRHEADWPDP